MGPGTTVVFVAVVGARFLVPLLIPRFPLPAIIACLVIDGVDQTVFQLFGYDPPGYQGYDKAMDVYYLAIAYLATMRNWQSMPAYRIGQFLYFYRLVGVVAFELTQVRPLLLVFCNTFEYYFIAYEAIRSRWSPVRRRLAFWATVAALIWVLVKLPQEYWIHIAKLDVTDTLAAHPAYGLVAAAVLIAVVVACWVVGRQRLPRPDWPWRIAADPLPEEMDTAAEQMAAHAEYGRVRSWGTAEKVVLVGLLSVVFAQTLPGIRASDLELFVGVSIMVVLNTVLILALARRAFSIESMARAFAARVAVNVAFVVLVELLFGRDPGNAFPAVGTLFFLCLISLITTMHDRFHPVLRVREERDRHVGGATAAAP
jgi:hypothetical protein